MKPIIVTAATFRELSLLAERIGTPRQSASLPFLVHEGRIGQRSVVLAVTGIGKVNTAACCTYLLENYTPRLLVSTGCAGAFAGSGLAVGELALASSEVFGDEGVLTPAGWESLDHIGLPLVERGGRAFFNELPLSLTATARAMQLAAALSLPVRRGRFLTVSTCSGTAARGEELESRFHAICENMEGAAAAQVALLYGVECLEVRGVSNLVEDRDLSRWDIPLAVEQAQRFLFKFIETL